MSQLQPLSAARKTKWMSQLQSPSAVRKTEWMLQPLSAVRKTSLVDWMSQLQPLSVSAVMKTEWMLQFQPLSAAGKAV